MMYFSKIKYFFISFIFLSSTSFCMKLNRIDIDDSRCNHYKEDGNINQDGETNQNEDDNIKAKEEKLIQLARIYSCLHNILVNLKQSKINNNCYYYVEINNNPVEFLRKIIEEVISPLGEFINENKEYMKVNCTFEWSDSAKKLGILREVNGAITGVKIFYEKQNKVICEKPDEEYKKKIKVTTSVLDKLMRIGCYIMDVLIIHCNEIYKEKKQQERKSFSNYFKTLFNDVINLEGVENHYKNLVLNLMQLYSFVLNFNKSIGENPKDSGVFSDEKFKYVSDLIFCALCNFNDVFLFSVKFEFLDLIVEKMINNNGMDPEIEKIFSLTYRLPYFLTIFLSSFVSKRYNPKKNFELRFISCLQCLISLLCDLSYFREGCLSKDINENVEKLGKEVNNINKIFFAGISFENFMQNCEALLNGNVSLDKKFECQMDNFDTEIIEDSHVMSTSDDYSYIPSVKVPLKEIDDNNRFVGCVSCRSKVQITDINKID